MITNTFYFYDDRTDVSLKTYIINETGELSNQGLRPAILILPGGGYFNCSDREAEPIALRFAAMGYHAFVLRYSTYLEGKEGFPDLMTEDFEVKTNLAHPAPVREVGMAMKLIHDHAEEWNVDARKVAICGFSAGAHNAAMFGVYWDKELITEFLSVPAEYIRPAALILSYTLSDYMLMKNAAVNPFLKAFFEKSTAAFLGKNEWTDEDLTAVSPARHVSEKTPPTFLWATSRDGLVPVQQTIRMSQALAEHGIPFEMHVFEEGDHGLALSDQATAVAKEQINADAAQWIPLVEKWLFKRFALNLPDKLPGFDAMVV